MSTQTRSDSVWFTVQFALCLATIVAPVVQRQRVPRIVRILGLSLFLSGAGIAGAGYIVLGRSHSPWSTPGSEARLVTTGIYRHIRHPIYLGWSLTAFGSALLFGSMIGLVVAATTMVFYDFRSHHEERLLLARYPAYAGYASSSSRFVPGVY